LRIHPIAKASALLGACLACVAPASAQNSGGLAYGTEGVDSIVVRGTTMLNRTVDISGTVAGAAAGEAVMVQRLLRSGTWETIATTTARAGGGFETKWRANHIGRHTLRAVTASAARATAVAATAQTTGRVTVYRPSLATWFGPGFYGRKTACGQTLTKRTLGVAHRTLPCGSQVELYFKGRTVTVPVVDRGPFADGKTWDLTKATADALGFGETARIGAVRVPAS
jgi:rare lipoprotein A (peptidoglycan hydrolase)